MSRCSRCTSNVKIINRFGDFDCVRSPSILRGSTKTRKAFCVAWISYECTRNRIAVPLIEEWFTCIWSLIDIPFHYSACPISKTIVQALLPHLQYNIECNSFKTKIPINQGLNLKVYYASLWDNFHTTWKNVLWIENDPLLNPWINHQAGTKDICTSLIAVPKELLYFMITWGSRAIFFSPETTRRWIVLDIPRLRNISNSAKSTYSLVLYMLITNINNLSYNVRTPVWATCDQNVTMYC